MLLIAITVGLMSFLLVFGVMLWLGARREAEASHVDWQARIGGGMASDKAVTVASTLGSHDPVMRWLLGYFWRAGWQLEETGLAKVAIVILGVAVAITALLGPAAGFVALFSCLGLVWGLLAQRESKRSNQILMQLPGFLEHLTRSLATGNTLEESLSLATQDAEEPIQGLFVSATRQIRLGAPVEDVMDDLAAIHRLRELSIMALAARVNRRYGGSLKRIYKSLVQAIREREAATRELRALTAETRFSAFVLAVVPIGIAVYILLQNPAYYTEMWNNSTGRGLILASVALQFAGVGVIWRMLQASESES